MDEKVEGPKPEETAPMPPAAEKPAEETKVETRPEPVAGAKAEPYYNRPVTRHDWMFFALVAVSVIALILLASTIMLAVAHGDHGCGRGEGRQMMKMTRNQQFEEGNGSRGFEFQNRIPRGQQSAPQQDQAQPTPPPPQGQTP
jgi:hypothetical protein